MKLFAWKNEDGLYLSRPPRPSRLVELDFDPDAPCVRCGERVLSISADGSPICPWCDSSMNRPKMLPYQELEIVRLLQRQSNENGATIPERKSIIGNKVTERELRDYLNSHGFYGSSANFVRLELAAIERPGWVQLFEFHIQAKSVAGVWEHLYGRVRSDERCNLFEVEFHGAPAVHRAEMKAQSSAMISHQRESAHWLKYVLMAVFGIAVAVAAAGALISQPPSELVAPSGSDSSSTMKVEGETSANAELP